MNDLAIQECIEWNERKAAKLTGKIRPGLCSDVDITETREKRDSYQRFADEVRKLNESHERIGFLLSDYAEDLIKREVIDIEEYELLKLWQEDRTGRLHGFATIRKHLAEVQAASRDLHLDAISSVCVDVFSKEVHEAESEPEECEAGSGCCGRCKREGVAS